MALIDLKFFSQTLGMQTEAYVIIPQKSTKGEIGIKGKRKDEEYKCVYLLHGLSDDHSIWLRRTSIERYAADYGACIVMPCGGRSFYTDMKYGMKYFSYITEELPSIVSEFFKVSNKREDTYIAGLSMGAATVLMSADQPLPSNVAGIVADCPYASPTAIIKKVCQTDMHLPSNLLLPFIKLGARLFAGFDLEESAPVTAVKNTPVPILIIHGERDRYVPCDMSRTIKAANPEKITLVTIPDAGHGLCYMTAPDIYENAMLEFFKKIL